MNSTSNTPLLNGMNNTTVSSNKINLSNMRPLPANKVDPVQPRFKRSGIFGPVLNMVKPLSHEERRFEKFKKALFNDDTNEVKRLIASGVNLNRKLDGIPPHDIPPLYIPVMRNRPDIVELLLAAGADPNPQLNFDEGPLIYHVLMIDTSPDTRFDVFRLLINAGADPSPAILQFLIENNAPKLLRLLIEKGTNLNFKNLYGKTPIHHAAIYNNPDIAKILLEAGANINIKDVFGKTPLDYAKTPEMRALLEKTKGGSRKSRKNKNKKKKTRCS